MNGYEEPEIRRLRSEGIHRLSVDLRQWSHFLLEELARDLENRGVTVVKENGLLGEEIESVPALRVRVDEVTPPLENEKSGAVLGVRLESTRSDFSLRSTSGPRAGFIAALIELKKRVLEDESFQAWMWMRQGKEKIEER